MKNKMQKFMSGRYGIDPLYRFLLLTALICMLLSSLLNELPMLGSLLSTASMLLLVWAIFRIFSRNIEKRYLENLHYLEWVAGIARRVKIRREMHRQRKEFKFFVCPTCRTNLRVPRGKGQIHITCCKCGNRFRGKT